MKDDEKSPQNQVKIAIKKLFFFTYNDDFLLESL
jgi:hypothetical protein